jgi:splicing factor 3B subunit 1
MLPPGYKVLDPPAGYQPIRTPSRKVTQTPTPMANGAQSGFFLQEEKEMSSKMKGQELQTADQDLPMLKPDDMQYFDKVNKIKIHSLSNHFNVNLKLIQW